MATTIIARSASATPAVRVPEEVGSVRGRATASPMSAIRTISTTWASVTDRTQTVVGNRGRPVGR